MVLSDITGKSTKYALILLVVISTAIRGVIAGIIELGNDEVYYWTYALFPDLSHFDHPPMVGFIIQAFTLDLFFSDEFFIRLGSVLFGGLNTFIIFLIGKKAKDKTTGFYAALLYNSSVYCFVIAGIFILPDTPQIFFWLLTIYLFIQAVPHKNPASREKLYMFLSGITIGLAMLSKYTSAFLWVGAMGYILFFNRIWLRKFDFYLAILMSLVVFSPVIMWNIENNFISFSYQGERVSFFSSGIRFDRFFTELAGQVLYNNPVNFVIILLSLVGLVKRKQFIDKPYQRLLLWMSLPAIILFLFFALFRQTLPHWTGPSYLGLILIAAAWLSEKYPNRPDQLKIPKSIITALGLLLVVLVVGVTQINFGVFNLSKEKNPTQLGKNDLTLDMYGWKQLSEKFGQIVKSDRANGIFDSTAVVVSFRWFPAAHQDYYLAHPSGINVLCTGSLERIHKYAWINSERGGFKAGMDAYFITSGRDYVNPREKYSSDFEFIEPPEIVGIKRGGNVVMYYFIYRMHDLIVEIPDPFEIK